ncbi:MAG TPA: hypothetical protein VH643_03655 [Gemmataceae bacterium]
MAGSGDNCSPLFVVAPSGERSARLVNLGGESAQTQLLHAREKLQHLAGVISYTMRHSFSTQA